MQRMSTIKKTIETIRAKRTCILHPPKNLTSQPLNSHLPADLVDFYNAYGSIEIGPDSDYPLFISSIDELTSSNLTILGETIDGDITSNWRVIARGRTDEYVSLDISPDRLGWCYDSFTDRHGVAGSCPILAMSFTEFLEKISLQKTERHFWLEKNFHSHGDAYD
jgi:hypothetical protein